MAERAARKGAIFDMDGVLVDNVDHHVQAWKLFAREHGRDLTDPAIRATFGQRNREMMEALLGESFSDLQLIQRATRKESLYRELMRPVLKDSVVPGLSHFLSELKGRDFKMAVATSGPVENLDFVLDGLTIRPFFDVLLTGGDVSRGKPHPDVFLLAAQRLQRAPAECIVFEDSASGIQAARRAGCACVPVATTHSPTELDDFSPTTIVEDFTRIGSAEIDGLLGG